MGSQLSAWAGLKQDPPDRHLLRSRDYRHEPPFLVSKNNFQTYIFKYDMFNEVFKTSRYLRNPSVKNVLTISK
jgi:hypothetical protein